MSSTDSPGVIAPPPLLFAGFLAVGFALDFGLIRVRTGWPGSLRTVLAVLLVVSAVLLVASALGRFRKAGTNAEPWKPATVVVTDGVYRFTRNPMYVSMGLIYFSVCLAADSVVSAAMLIPLLAAVRYGVIGREERYLEAKFGDDYRRYRASVRRWI